MDDKQMYFSDPIPGVDRLLRVDEIASILSISRSFAYQLLQTGQIPVVRLGKACRVRPQDLEEFVERNLHTQVVP